MSEQQPVTDIERMRAYLLELNKDYFNLQRLITRYRDESGDDLSQTAKFTLGILEKRLSDLKSAKDNLEVGLIFSEDKSIAGNV